MTEGIPENERAVHGADVGGAAGNNANGVAPAAGGPAVPAVPVVPGIKEEAEEAAGAAVAEVAEKVDTEAAMAVDEAAATETAASESIAEAEETAAEAAEKAAAAMDEAVIAEETAADKAVAAVDEKAAEADTAAAEPAKEAAADRAEAKADEAASAAKADDAPSAAKKAGSVKKPAAKSTTKKTTAKSSTKKPAAKSTSKKSSGAKKSTSTKSSKTTKTAVKSSVSKPKAAAAATAPAAASSADGAAGIAANLASRTFGLPVLIGVAVVVAILAGLLGSCIAGGGHSTTPKLSESQLNQPVASYTYKGSKHDVTAREAIESQYGVEQMKDADGNYSAPSTETILRYVRNLVICEDAKAQGINPTDEELLAYAKETLNTDNFDAVAKMYGVSADQAKEIVRVTCTVNKLNEQVSNAGPKAPEPPSQPKKGDEDKATADYGKYIAQVLGDAWDAEKDDWATTEGYLHEILANQEFSSSKATYNQANTVYQAAFQNYSVNVASERQSWSDYMNNLFKDASIDVYGLYL